MKMEAQKNKPKVPKLANQKLQSHMRFQSKKYEGESNSSTNVTKLGSLNPTGGLMSARKFGGNGNNKNLNYQNQKQKKGGKYFDVDQQQDDNISVGYVRRMDSDSGEDESYLSLKISGMGGDYSDVESSGNILKLESKNSESNYITNRDDDSYSDNIQVIDGNSSFGGSMVSGT